MIYGDTDSIMIHSRSKSLPEARGMAATLKKEVNRLYKCLEIEVDGVFEMMLLLKKKKCAPHCPRAALRRSPPAALASSRCLAGYPAGCCCGIGLPHPASANQRPLPPSHSPSHLLFLLPRYAALVVDAEDGAGRATRWTRETKGLDLVRRDWCPLSREVGSKVLDLLLSARPRDEIVEAVHEYLRSVAADVRANKLPIEQVRCALGSALKCGAGALRRRRRLLLLSRSCALAASRPGCPH